MTYQLEVRCDHRRNAPNSTAAERVVSTIIYTPRAEDADNHGWLDWRELDVPGYPAALQTFFGEAERLGRYPRHIDVDQTGEPTLEDFERLANAVPGMDHGQRWRFWCADCDDTVPVKHPRFVELLEVFRDAGVPSVTLAALAPRV